MGLTELNREGLISYDITNVKAHSLEGMLGKYCKYCLSFEMEPRESMSIWASAAVHEANQFSIVTDHW